MPFVLIYSMSATAVNEQIKIKIRKKKYLKLEWIGEYFERSFVYGSALCVLHILAPKKKKLMALHSQDRSLCCQPNLTRTHVIGFRHFWHHFFGCWFFRFVFRYIFLFLPIFIQLPSPRLFTLTAQKIVYINFIKSNTQQHYLLCKWNYFLWELIP